MSDESTKHATEPAEPGEESLREMPEITDPRFHRRPGRGHHAERKLGNIVLVDEDLWSHFGSARAVNDALRRIVKGSHRRS
jgi:hypothetical protein